MNNDKDFTVARRRNVLWLLGQYIKSRIDEGAQSKGLEQEWAGVLQIAPSLLSQIKSGRPIGNKLARQIESACNKPAGWLDEEHEEDVPPNAAETAFLDAAKRAWRGASSKEKRALMRAMKGDVSAWLLISGIQTGSRRRPL